LIRPWWSEEWDKIVTVQCSNSVHLSGLLLWENCAKRAPAIPIQEKPLRVLAALAERQGELVSGRIARHFVEGETFVDFTTG